VRAGLGLGVFEAPCTVNMQNLVINALPPDRMLAGDFLAEGLSVLLVLNVMLVVFNLLPFPPLDGASVVAIALPRKASRSLRAAIAMPGLSLMGIVAAWQVFPACAKPVLGTIAALLYPAPR
jgi:Zn-dependent protease